MLFDDEFYDEAPIDVVCFCDNEAQAKDFVNKLNKNSTKYLTCLGVAGMEKPRFEYSKAQHVGINESFEDFISAKQEQMEKNNVEWLKNFKEEDYPYASKETLNEIRAEKKKKEN